MHATRGRPYFSAPFLVRPAILVVILLLVGAPALQAEVMEWGGNFTDINLGNITAQDSVVESSGTCTLYTDGNVDISADNTTTAELSEAGGDTLVTNYKLTDDGNGTTSTGGTDQTEYTEYNSFLSATYVVTHVAGDGAVIMTLHCKASNDSGNVANAGSYSATQTLTASWGTQ